VWQRTDGKRGRTKSVASVGLCDFNEMADAAFATLFSGDDLTKEELLEALESPKGMTILRKVILSRPGDDGDDGSLFSKIHGLGRAGCLRGRFGPLAGRPGRGSDLDPSRPGRLWPAPA
jgi:hypothetical protein